MLTTILPIKLNLFDGEGAAAGGEGTAAEAASKGNDPSQIVYGKQPAEAPQSSEPNAPEQPADAKPATEEDLGKEFRDMIRGKFKDQYAAEVQRAIDRRFKSVKTTEQRLAQAEPILDSLVQKYGLKDASDLEALQAAVDKDDSLIEDAAYAEGMSVDQYREFQRLKRQNAVLQRQQEIAEEQQQVRETAEKWYAEAESLKQKYADFNLEECLADEGFMKILNAGVPMETAYVAKYHDKLMSQATAFVATQAQKDVTDTIRAKGLRPMENGASSANAGVITKSDPSKLTLKEFDEIARRAARGEKIVF